MKKTQGIMDSKTLFMMRRELQRKYRKDSKIREYLETLLEEEGISEKEKNIIGYAYKEVQGRLYYTSLLDSLWEEIDEIQEEMRGLHVYNRLEGINLEEEDFDEEDEENFEDEEDASEEDDELDFEEDDSEEIEEEEDDEDIEVEEADMIEDAELNLMEEKSSKNKKAVFCKCRAKKEAKKAEKKQKKDKKKKKKKKSKK